MRKSQWRTGAFCESTGYGNRQFVTLDKNNTGTAYKYIFLDAPGNISDYMELDVAGKIVFVSMDGLSFADEVNYAVARGAAAVVICYDDDDVYGLDLTGIYYSNPVVAISRSDARAVMTASEKISDIAYAGTMTVYGQSGLGAGTALTTSFTIDNTAPEILDIDLSGEEQDRLTVRP